MSDRIAARVLAPALPRTRTRVVRETERLPFARSQHAAPGDTLADVAEYWRAHFAAQRGE